MWTLLLLLHRFLLQHTADPLLLSTLNINERSGSPVALCSLLTIYRTEPVASWGSQDIKATAQDAKTLADPTHNYFFSRSAESLMWNPHTFTRGRTSALTSVPSVVPILQSWKRSHSKATPGTPFSKQASQWCYCSVIISTMTVWVDTKCHAGKHLLSAETASLFLRLTFIYNPHDNGPFQFKDLGYE